VKDWVQLILALAFGVFVVGALIWFAIAQWSECREMGFSMFYCLKHIS